jgi:hypothetical protein
MFRNIVAFALILAAPVLHATPPDEPPSWQARVGQALPLFGHRNWILIVDSAYPLQSSPGVETVDTRAALPVVLHFVLDEIDNSEHVRPEIFMDAELPFVSEEDAPEVEQYRTTMADMLRAYGVQSLPHEKLIATVNEAGKTFQVLVLKTTSTIPYSSVFIRLKAKYWSDEAEARLRKKMGAKQ